MVHRLQIAFIAAPFAFAMCVPGYAANLVIKKTNEAT
jgi:hypothetical protein